VWVGRDELARDDLPAPGLTSVRPTPRAAGNSHASGTYGESMRPHGPLPGAQMCRNRSASVCKFGQRRRVAGEGGRRPVSLAAVEWAEPREFRVELLGHFDEHSISRSYPSWRVVPMLS